MTITASCSAEYPLGMLFAVCGSPAESGSGARAFSDWLDGLLGSRPQNGYSVKADAGALGEAIENGSVHSSLVVEPNGGGHPACPERPLDESAQAA